MTDQADIAGKLDLPPPSQVCIVVRDLQQAAAHYGKLLKIGPFVFPKIVYKNITYRGQPSDGYWEMAFARMGHLELELSCPVRTPSIYEDFLNEQGEGLHHLGFDIEDLDATIARAESLGIDVLMSGRTDQGGFDHLDTTKTGGTILELIQRPAPRV